MADVEALLDEISDWGVQNFPLAGGDVLSMLVKHGITTKEAAQAAYARARERHHEWGGAEVTYGMKDVTDEKDMIDF